MKNPKASFFHLISHSTHLYNRKNIYGGILSPVPQGSHPQKKNKEKKFFFFSVVFPKSKRYRSLVFFFLLSIFAFEVGATIFIFIPKQSNPETHKPLERTKKKRKKKFKKTWHAEYHLTVSLIF